jgi:hypothetical protein
MKYIGMMYDVGARHALPVLFIDKGLPVISSSFLFYIICCTPAALFYNNVETRLIASVRALKVENVEANKFLNKTI